jgi:hypothetical protein
MNITIPIAAGKRNRFTWIRELDQTICVAYVRKSHCRFTTAVDAVRLYLRALTENQ